MPLRPTGAMTCSATWRSACITTDAIIAARAIGLDRDLGSLEAGKKADIILLDGFKPHLYPPVMPLNRVTHFASAADVDTVIVDGAILMEHRRPKQVPATAILEQAETIAAWVFDNAGLTDQRREQADIWQTRRKAGAKDF